MATPEVPKTHKFIMKALDPIHVGTGGYRLGRVDLTIMREPWTNLPKVPGTTLSGASKFFSDLYLRVHYPTLKDRSCASADPEDERACKRPECPICYTYGYTSKGERGSYKGVLLFHDAAHIVFFPVRSMLGPVWVTTPRVLEEHLGIPGLSVDEERIKSSLAREEGTKLNLGWILFEAGPLTEEEQRAITSISQVDPYILQRVVLVDDWIFTTIVNDNLEVRTSVSIDPDTGAARERALFTYEALPRATILAFNVDENDYRAYPERYKDYRQYGINTPLDVLKLSFPYIKAVGLGGMTTRGFGRLEIRHVSTKEVLL